MCECDFFTELLVYKNSPHTQTGDRARDRCYELGEEQVTERAVNKIDIKRLGL